MYDIFSGDTMKTIPLAGVAEKHYIDKDGCMVWVIEHAIESNRDSFFVCHGHSNFRTVSEIDSEGREIRVFDSKQRLYCGHIALDSVGRLLVADWNNKRVVVLNDRLKYERIFNHKKLLDKAVPVRMNFDINCNTLMVGLIDGKVLIFDC